MTHHRTVVIGVPAVWLLVLLAAVSVATPPEAAAGDGSSCVTTDQELLKQVVAKVERHKTTEKKDLLEMFKRSHATMQGKDTYTVADIKARPDKQARKWQGRGPNNLWQKIYKELNRLANCRDKEGADTPATPEVSISGGSGVTEGGSASFTVTASPAPASALTVTIAVSQSGKYAVAGAIGTKTVTIPTSGSTTYTVATVDDSVDEADGSITVTLNNSHTDNGMTQSTGLDEGADEADDSDTANTGDGYTVSATNSAATVTVKDNDAAIDYDVDDDGLIEVSSLIQLNAIRFDLDGDGVRDTYVKPMATLDETLVYTHQDPMGGNDYVDAYPNALSGMGCPNTGCKGYEMTKDLDFDTNGNGKADAGDEYWNGGKGWKPIMGVHVRSYSLGWDLFLDPTDHRPDLKFKAIFEGNGHTIDNLYIKDYGHLHFAGLFGITEGATIRNVGLLATNSDAIVEADFRTGALVGMLEGGSVRASYSHLKVLAKGEFGGGLIGEVTTHGTDGGTVVESYATGEVRADAFGGGLAGSSYKGRISASFATGKVTGEREIHGGLVGEGWDGTVQASYATGNVVHLYLYQGNYGGSGAGGLIGETMPYNVHRANYAIGQVTVKYPENADERAGWDDPIGPIFSACWQDEGKDYDPFAEDTYWNSDIPVVDERPADKVSSSPLNQCVGVTGYTTAQLQKPTSYSTTQTIDGKEVAIYAKWDLDLDSDGFADDPWDFGTSSQYPILKYCAAKPGIDTNNDGVSDSSDVYCPLREAEQHGRTLSP